MKEEVQKYITEVLRLMMQKIPCEIGRHGFMLGDDGKLNLQIKIGDRFQAIIFDENYTNESPEELVNGIYGLLEGQTFLPKPMPRETIEVPVDQGTTRTSTGK